MNAQKTSRDNESEKSGPNRRPLILLLIILSLVFAVTYTGRLGKLARTQAQLEITAQKIEEATLRQAALLKEQAYVESEGYVDDIARGEMGMGQPGESLVVIVGEPDVIENDPTGGDIATAPAEVGEASSSADNDSFSPIWRQWMGLFIQSAS